jgi:hypothetical protein
MYSIVGTSAKCVCYRMLPNTRIADGLYYEASTANENCMDQVKWFPPPESNTCASSMCGDNSIMLHIQNHCLKLGFKRVLRKINNCRYHF